MRGRLQRAPDFTGTTLTRFREVFLRHGIAVAAVGLLALGWPHLRPLAGQSIAGASAHPVAYLVASLAAGGVLIGYVWWRRRALDLGALAWVLYLLAVSLWEEWVFRVVIPYGGGATGADLLILVVASNILFAVMHYFTLRWRWQWCVLAGLGGLALSRQMHVHFDLVQVVLMHWIGTTLNTPSPPGRSATADG